MARRDGNGSSCSAQCDDATAAPLDDDCEAQSLSTSAPARLRGGRSKKKHTVSKALEDKIDEKFNALESK